MKLFLLSFWRLSRCSLTVPPIALHKFVMKLSITRQLVVVLTGVRQIGQILLLLNH